MPDGSDIDALKASLAAAEAKAAEAEEKASDAEAMAVAAEARAANAEAKVSDAQAQITAMKLMIEKLRRELYGQRSERKQRLLDQMELQLDELEASATEDELAAEQAAAGTTQVKGFKRWDGFTRFLQDGRICLTNNASERGLRGIALGRRSWLFCGSDCGGVRAAAIYTTDRTDPMTPRKLGSVLAWMRGLLSTPRRMDRLEEELPSEPGASRQLPAPVEGHRMTARELAARLADLHRRPTLRHRICS